MEEKFFVAPSRLRLGGALLLLILIIGLGFVLRIQEIDAFSFWTDEGLTPLRSGYSIPEILSNRVTIQEGVTNDTHPALFFLIVHFSRQLFGESDFAFRFPALLLSILTLPLAFQLGRRLADVRLGLIFAALLAINPLQIYYANEARMYPLLVFLMLAATYILWRAIQLSQSELGRYFLPMAVYVLLYFVLAGLAIYTHYTAVFVIALQSLFWVWILWRSGFKKLLIGTAVCAIFVAIPLVPYTIPRFFKGYEANFTYVSPLIMFQDVYRFFALGRSVDYKDPLIQLLLYIVLGLAILGLYAAKPNYRRLFLLAYLMAVVLGLMAGSFFKPMYQGVRHIMAGSPAYLILVGWGLLFLFEQVQTSHKIRRVVWGILGIAGLLAILLSTTIALNNYFNNDKYGKSDLRGLIHLIETHAGANDVVIYNDAILLPTHEHYQQRSDVAFTASPIYPTNAAATSPAQLTELAQTYARIWFITGAPADTRDETGFVQDWLDAHLMPSENFTIESKAGLVEAKLYSTAPLTAVSHTTPLAQWPNWPILSGYSLESEQPLSLPVIWFNLLWESDEKPASNMGLQFQLLDKSGRIWAQHFSSIMPSNRDWHTTEPNQQIYHLPLSTGTPPGNYTLQAQPVQITNNGRTLIDEPIALDTIEIAPNATWPLQPIWVEQAPRLLFENDFALQKTILPDTSVRPGHNLPLTLYWQSDEAQTGLHYELTVLNNKGDILRTQTNKPGAEWLDSWSAHTLFREDTGLYFPPQTEPGIYSLHLQLFQNDAIVTGRPYWQPWSSESNKIGQINVEPWPIETELPSDATPVNAQFGTAIELASYQLAQKEDALDLILYWQATAVPDKNLFTFVHLTDANGNIVAQIDFVPVNGLRPTAGWRKGEVITDPYILPLPADLPAGEYQLAVGLFDPDTFERPFVIQQNQEQPNNQIVLSQITLPEK